MLTILFHKSTVVVKILENNIAFVNIRFQLTLISRVGLRGVYLTLFTRAPAGFKTAVCDAGSLNMLTYLLIVIYFGCYNTIIEET